MIARILFAASLLVALPAAAQQVYRWVDANGNVNFSSTPPPDARAAEPVDLPPTPSAEEVEAARQREQSLQQLGDQLSQERQDRESQRAEERKAAQEAAAPQQPPPQPSDSGDDWSYGWWIPGQPNYRPHPRPRPPWPERPVPPGPRRDPTAPPDHPAFWPREPVLPPVTRPGRPVEPAPLPSLPARR
jgi:hypothetical protein